MPLQSWLDLLCRMIPGVSQAILLTEPVVQPAIQWPITGIIDDDVIAVAKLAAGQKQPVTTTLSSKQGDDEIADVVFALNLSGPDNFNGSVAIRVSVKPSRQSPRTR